MSIYKVYDRVIYKDDKVYILLKKYSKTTWISSPEIDDGRFGKMWSSYIETHHLDKEWLFKPVADLFDDGIKGLASKRECVRCSRRRERYHA